MTSMKNLTPCQGPSVTVSLREQTTWFGILSSFYIWDSYLKLFVGSLVQYLSWFHPNIVLGMKKILRKYTADVRRKELWFEFCQIGFYTDHILLSGRGLTLISIMLKIIDVMVHSSSPLAILTTHLASSARCESLNRL